MLFTKPTMVDPRVALKGRDVAVLNQPFFHRVFGHRIDRVPEGAEVAVLGLGCFWGAEKLYWNTPGVLNTAVGYWRRRSRWTMTGARPSRCSWRPVSGARFPTAPSTW